MLRNRFLVVLPALDGHDRRLVLGLEPPDNQVFRRVGVTGRADKGRACPDRTVPLPPICGSAAKLRRARRFAENHCQVVVRPRGAEDPLNVCSG
jgi:hypothetical protein